MPNYIKISQTFDVAIQRFFEMVAVRHLGFRKLELSTVWMVKTYSASLCQISRRSVNLLLRMRYHDFVAFKMA